MSNNASPFCSPGMNRGREIQALLADGHALGHAKVLAACLRAVGIHGRVWQKDGSTRVYVGNSYIAVARGGEVDCAGGRVPATYVPQKGYSAAYRAYCVDLNERVVSNLEEVDAYL